jgi:hypothetical protein
VEHDWLASLGDLKLAMEAEIKLMASDFGGSR